jgi:hypothetical protein
LLPPAPLSRCSERGPSARGLTGGRDYQKSIDRLTAFAIAS